MDENTVLELRREAEMGIAALQGNRSDVAAVHFNNALNRAEALKGDRTRRDELSALAGLLDQYGFPDLGLAAAEDAVELDQRLGLESLGAQDLIEVGNAHVSLENTVKAEQCFRDAVAVLLRRNEYASAASANSNLAALLANRGEVAQAIELFQKSLEYLAQESFDFTEIQTRIGLLETLEHTNGDLDTALENARRLCSRFFEQIPEPQLQAVRKFIGKLVKRYLDAHRNLVPKEWKSKTFPMLYA